MHIYICGRLLTNMKQFIILCICSILSSRVQCKAAYKLKVSRAEMVRYNKEYTEGRLWVTKPDRYTNAVSCELVVYNIPQDTEVKIKMYEFLSNEYRPFAVNLVRRLCSFMVLEYKMMLYPDYIKLGGHMPEPRCPVMPGNYSYANSTPNIDNYPPGLPFRNFLLSIEFWHGTVEIALVKVYGTLDRDAVIREQYA